MIRAIELLDYAIGDKTRIEEAFAGRRRRRARRLPCGDRPRHRRRRGRRRPPARRRGRPRAHVDGRDRGRRAGDAAPRQADRAERPVSRGHAVRRRAVRAHRRRRAGRSLPLARGHRGKELYTNNQILLKTITEKILKLIIKKNYGTNPVSPGKDGF